MKWFGAVGIVRRSKAKRMLWRARALPLRRRRRHSDQIKTMICSQILTNFCHILRPHTRSGYGLYGNVYWSCKLWNIISTYIYPLPLVLFAFALCLCGLRTKMRYLCLYPVHLQPCLSRGESASPNTQYWFAQARRLCDCGKRMFTMTLPLEHWLVHSNSGGRDGKMPSSCYSMRFNFE